MLTVQDNRDLQNRIAQSITTDVGEMRSMHDELSILEESGYDCNAKYFLTRQIYLTFAFIFENFRQGKMCRRCLRSMDEDNIPDYASSIACTEDGDDASLNEMMQRANSSQNIYRSGISAANQVIKNFLFKLIFAFNKYY